MAEQNQTRCEENNASRLQRWDNPVYMPCSHEDVSRYASWHVAPCGNAAAYVTVEGESVTAFHCQHHRERLGVPLPMYGWGRRG
jgi:hypothetical protein